MSDGDIERPLTVFYLGNFKPPYSTENDYRLAWKANGHRVHAIQEGNPELLRQTVDDLSFTKPDLFVWTRTPDLAALNGDALQLELILQCRQYNIPIIGVHLDRWWGLQRQVQIETDPFFRVDLLLTADGAHNKQWQEAGVRHAWLPPGVSEQWCKPGERVDKHVSEVAFVGGWQGGYHAEAEHRHLLVAWLKEVYGERVKFWPALNQHAIRGTQLTDLYWSTTVVVGDSCLVPTADGSPMSYYCSDRIPETNGRGGYLLHPLVVGINANEGDPFYGTEWWEMNDWNQLREVIDCELEDPEFSTDDYRMHRIEIAKRDYTYERRVPEIIDKLHRLRIL